MNSKERIEQGLSRLAGTSPAPDLGHEDGVLQLVLRAIDETILPRLVEFSSVKDQVLFSCIVGNRRLLRMSGISDAQLDALNSALEAGETENDPAFQRHLRELIKGKLNGHATVVAKRIRLDNDDAMSSLGVSASHLSEAWVVPIYGPLVTRETAPMERLAQWATANAVHLWTGDGEKPDARLPDDLADTHANLSANSQNSLVCMSCEPEPDLFCVAQQDGAYAALIISEPQFAGLLSAWYGRE